MCNIAGYVGSRPAAPILIEMMRRQEGWGGGYYTGIATLSEGRIHSAKRTGDLERLCKHTDAASLPGNTGILHSRSPSGGDDEWAHPFVGERNGTVCTAYVANGAQGCFSDRIDEICKAAVKLEDEGFVFRSKTNNAVGNYPRLSDGSCVHMSDVMAQLITSKILCGSGAAEAMEASFCEMPGEIVGLLLALNEPDAIAWSRINMPMFVGFAPHGAYLATTPQAFPEDAGEPILLPACSGGRVYARNYTVKPYGRAPAAVAPILPETVAGAYRAITEAAGQEACGFDKLSPVVHNLFRKADCFPTNALIYAILAELEKAGKLDVIAETVQGMVEGLTAPVFRGKLK